MKQYNVTGMSCAACAARVEKAVSAVEGVTSCSVNLLTRSMGVEGTASDAAITAAVVQAGYGASPKGSAPQAAAAEPENPEDKEIRTLKQRLMASLVFLAALMYLSMGHTMWHWPLPEVLCRNPAAIGILQLLLAAAVMVINQRFFVSGFRSLWHRAPNMDSLVAMGSGVSFLYSVYELLALTDAQATGLTEQAAGHLHGLYFESAAMILTLITVGKLLEARSKGKTTDALRALMKLAPKTAVLVRDGIEVTVPVEEVREGDVFAVRPGESIPADGIVLEGHSAVNESALTGESIPADKEAGSRVSAATINQSGYLLCRAVRVGENTALSQIIRMVSDAAATKAPIARLADRVSGVFVPVVMGIAAVTTVVWLLTGQTAGFALSRGISVLVISCPCALGLATPVAIMVGNGVGAKHGILFKTAASLENTGKARVVALDKTGTLTSGAPRVTDILPAGDASAEELLRLACALEAKSEHPLAKAIAAEADAKGITPADVTDFEALPGNGLTAKLNGSSLCAGNLSFVSTRADVPDFLQVQAEALAEGGKTPLYFARDGRVLGLIAVADTLKDDSAAAVRALRDMGLHVVMLTGDNERTARAIGRQAGVDEVIAGVLPGEKEAAIRSLREKGEVIMVGDGINDAPALTRADIGIAIGAGTDVAIDAADVVLMNSRLGDVPAAIRISRAALRNIRQNLFWAFFYNAIGIPLAAGVFIPLFGWQLSPMFGAAAMSLSSFCVVSNALRLNLLDPHGSHNDRPISKAKETTPMQKTLKINGMMCGHCSGRVKKALEALPQVTEAVVSHENGTAVVTLNADVADAVLKQTVEAEGYEVIG